MGRVAEGAGIVGICAVFAGVDVVFQAGAEASVIWSRAPAEVAIDDAVDDHLIFSYTY